MVENGGSRDGESGDFGPLRALRRHESVALFFGKDGRGDGDDGSVANGFVR